MKNDNDWLVELMAKVLVLFIFIAGYFGLAWLIWLLWTWVIPQLWPAGPQVFINPGYWLFVAAWFLASIVFRMIFGGKK